MIASGMKGSKEPVSRVLVVLMTYSPALGMSSRNSLVLGRGGAVEAGLDRETASDMI
jgi:hypothetical protein